jgi:ERCC4-type nuclease|tara:strand:- start:722 stop:1510 length:789 start_codon:yes stop_codon:yes gene_type:complete
MLIKIDVRETSLIEKCENMVSNFQNIKLQIVQLHIGDAIICDDEGCELIVIERKTLNDLASSIKDGRYKEQGYRLNGMPQHNHNIFYLVEGTLQTYNPNKSHLERKALLSSFISITYFKGFSIHRTDNVMESAEWMLAYANKIHKEKTKPYYNDINEMEVNKPMDYVNVVSKVKMDNITKENIGAIMLSQIPRVSSKIAIAVMEVYETIYNLIIELKKNPKILEGLSLESNGKFRKISKTATANIYNYLIPNSNPSISVDTE